MRSLYRPKALCDRECALVNGCQVGGIQCEGCGCYFCADDLDEYNRCDNCTTNEESEDEDGEM